jgi:LysM repeat protein
VILDNANASSPEPSYEKGHDSLSRQSHDLLIKRHQHDESVVVKVKQDDTMSKLAQTYLGQDANIHQIYNYVIKVGKENNIRNLNHIEPGQTLYFPPIQNQKHADQDNLHPRGLKSVEAPLCAKPADPAAKFGAAGKPLLALPGDHAAKTGPDRKPLVDQPAEPAAKTLPDRKPIVDQLADGSGQESDDIKPLVSRQGADALGVLPPDRESPLAAIGHGMEDELTDNTLGLLGSFSVGAAAVAASKFLPGWGKWAMAGVGAATAAYETYEHGGELAKSAQVESNVSAYSAAELKQSNDTLHNFGRGISDFSAGVIGGGLAGLATSALRSGGLGFAGSSLSKIRLSGSPLYEKSLPPGMPKAGLTAPGRQISLEAPPRQLLLTGPKNAEPAPGKQLALAGPENAANPGALPRSVIALPGLEQATGEATPTVQKLLTGPKSDVERAAPQGHSPAVAQEEARTDKSTATRAAASTESTEANAGYTANRAVTAEVTESVKDVKIESPSPIKRTYEVGGQKYELFKLGNQSWFYGKNSGAAGDVKIHVNVSGPEDLARVQKALIPFLMDNAVASRLATAWKTFDPEAGFAPRSAGSFGPGPTGQEAKGFTIYAKNPAKARKLQALVDKELASKGLSLQEPLDTGNVDLVEGQSGRVGTVRDYFPATKDAVGNIGAKLDDTLASRIEAKFGQGQKLNNSELRAVEQQSGLQRDTLTYDRYGKLMLILQDISHPANGRMYVDESRAVKAFGQMTDRPAIYALSKLFGWNPADA